MRPSWRIAAAAAAFCALAACQVSPPGQLMTGADVRAAFIGNTQHGKSVDGEFLTYMLPDGSVRGLFGARADTGTAQISPDGRYCVTWHQTYDGKPVCRMVQRTSSGYALVNDGGITSATITMTPGNGNNL